MSLFPLCCLSLLRDQFARWQQYAVKYYVIIIENIDLWIAEDDGRPLLLYAINSRLSCNLWINVELNSIDDWLNQFLIYKNNVAEKSQNSRARQSRATVARLLRVQRMTIQPFNVVFLAFDHEPWKVRKVTQQFRIIPVAKSCTDVRDFWHELSIEMKLE